MSGTKSGADPILSGETVLVTGGGGFIGGHLVDKLAETNDVTVLDHFGCGSRDGIHPDVSVIEGDVKNRDDIATAMEGVDIVFHQAGLVSVPTSIEQPVASQRTNVSGTINLLEEARRADARTVVASSAAVYGHPETVPVPEESRLSPTSPYGVDKLAVDHYTRLFEELYGLPTVALRYFNVYGPGQPDNGYSGVIETFLEQARAGDPITVHGDGSQTRDFVHVDDVVRANLRAAETPHVGRAFNVGTGRETTIESLARTVKRVTGSESEIVHVDGREGDIDESIADLDAARSRLGYTPQVSLADGLATLVD